MNKIKIIDNLKIIENESEKICIKKNKDKRIIEIQRYLKSRDFNNYIETSIENGYEKRKYIDEVSIKEEDKLTKLIYLLSMLHIKTTHFNKISEEKIKGFYEKSIDDLNELNKFYNNIFDSNVTKLFNKPSISLLIKNFSNIQISLDNSKYFLDKWYEIIIKKQSKRKSILHNNLKITNYIFGENQYLINWDKSKIDSPIYDIKSLFKNNYKKIDMYDLFNIYESKYKLYDEENFLLYYELLKIDKISFGENELLNTRKIKDILKYLTDINIFLKKNTEYKKEKDN